MGHFKSRKKMVLFKSSLRMAPNARMKIVDPRTLWDRLGEK